MLNVRPKQRSTYVLCSHPVHHNMGASKSKDPPQPSSAPKAEFKRVKPATATTVQLNRQALGDGNDRPKRKKNLVMDGDVIGVKQNDAGGMHSPQVVESDDFMETDGVRSSLSSKDLSGAVEGGVATINGVLGDGKPQATRKGSTKNKVHAAACDFTE
jgi:hypothetical protein